MNEIRVMRFGACTIAIRPRSVVVEIGGRRSGLGSDIDGIRFAKATFAEMHRMRQKIAELERVGEKRGLLADVCVERYGPGGEVRRIVELGERGGEAPRMEECCNGREAMTRMQRLVELMGTRLGGPDA